MIAKGSGIGFWGSDFGGTNFGVSRGGFWEFDFGGSGLGVGLWGNRGRILRGRGSGFGGVGVGFWGVGCRILGGADFGGSGVGFWFMQGKNTAPVFTRTCI